MKSTEKRKFRLNWVLACVVWTLIGTLFIWDILGDKDRHEIATRLIETQREVSALQREHEDSQDFKIRSGEDRLKVLESTVVEILKANPKQSDSKVVLPAVRQDESASNVEPLATKIFDLWF